MTIAKVILMSCKKPVVAPMVLAFLGMTSTSAFAAVTVFAVAGGSCMQRTSDPGMPLARVTQDARTAQVSLCMTTTTEHVCGFSLHLQSDSRDDAHFTVLTRTPGANYPEPTIESLPPSTAIRVAMSTEDYGASIRTGTKPIPPQANQLLATFTLAPTAAARKGNYDLLASKRSIVAVATDGSCEFPKGVEIPTTLRVEKQ